MSSGPTYPLLILCGLAATSMIFASTRNPGRFTVSESQGAGNVAYGFILKDRATGKAYPLYDLMDENRKLVGAGVLVGQCVEGNFAIPAEIGAVSK